MGGIQAETKPQLTVATNSSTKPHFLLHQLDKLGTYADTTLNIELWRFLDTRGRLDAFDVTRELRAHFADGPEVICLICKMRYGACSMRRYFLDLDFWDIFHSSLKWILPRGDNN